MGRRLKGLMTFDSKKVNQKENDILNETFILIFVFWINKFSYFKYMNPDLQLIIFQSWR